MKKAVIDDWDGFSAFLAAQPFCQWAAQKEYELAHSMHFAGGPIVQPQAPKKNDNAELAAALASMA